MSNRSNFEFRIAATVAVILIATTLGAQTKDNTKVVKLLEGYRDMMAVELDGDIEDIPRESWLLVSRAISEGFLRFTVDPTLDSLQRGARFSADPGSNVTHIILTQNLVDVWETSPSTAYAILTRAIHEASLFFRNPHAWGSIRNDISERLFVRMENYVAEALLIRDRLLPAGYSLSDYETYILESYEKDRLNSVCLFLERYSLPVAQGLNEMRLTYEEKEDSQKLRNSVIDIGEALLNARMGLPKDSDDKTVYPLAVAVHTWLDLTPAMISRIHNKNRPDDPLEFHRILELEQEYAALRQRLETSRTRDMPLIAYINNQTITGFQGF